MSDEPIVTKSGKVLTDTDIEALSDEAEIGYNPHTGEPIAKILTATTDAAVWAYHFKDQFAEVMPDEHTMLTWFANAIETGRSHCLRFHVDVGEPCDVQPGLAADGSCPTCGHRVGAHVLSTHRCDVCAIIRAALRG